MGLHEYYSSFIPPLTSVTHFIAEVGNYSILGTAQFVLVHSICDLNLSLIAFSLSEIRVPLHYLLSIVKVMLSNIQGCKVTFNLCDRILRIGLVEELL